MADTKQAHRQRLFKPLNAETTSNSGAPKLEGIIFDVDGTLCKPQNYMFAQMREALGIAKSVDILDHVYTLPEPEQEPAMEKIRAIERAAMAEQEPQPGLAELMDYADSRGLRKGICTRNFDLPVNHLLEKFLPGREFGPIVTRGFRPPKPHPAGILHIASAWGVTDPSSPSTSQPAEGQDSTGERLPLIMVGDSVDDMTAGRRAGAATVLLLNDSNAELEGHEHTDLSVKRLDALINVLEKGFVGRGG